MASVHRKTGSAQSARVESVSISLDDLRAAAEAMKPPAGWLTTAQIAQAIGRTRGGVTVSLHRNGVKPHRQNVHELWWNPADVMELVKGGKL
jgi:hypothetical protein